MNFGKDFKRDSFELIARGPPGSYVSTSAVDYEFMTRGALPFITEQKVGIICRISWLQKLRLHICSM